MANSVINVLPIEVDLKPEARAKPAPDRSRDQDRFQRHLESSTSERPQRPERSSVSRQNDPQPAERETRPHRTPESTDPPTRPETPTRDSSGEVAGREQAHETHSDHTRRADHNSPDAAQDAPHASSEIVQAPTDQTIETGVLPLDAPQETTTTDPVANGPAGPAEPLLAGPGPELIAPSQISPVNGPGTPDTPSPSITPVPTALGETTPLQGLSKVDTTDEIPSQAPAPLPDLSTHRPELPVAALNGLHIAAANIPEDFSGQGRPGDTTLIEGLPAVADDRPLLPVEAGATPPVIDPLTGAPAVQLEIGEPLAFEAPDPEIGHNATGQGEITTDIAPLEPVTAAVTPDDGEPIPLSSSAPIPVEPLLTDLTIPSTSGSDESALQGPITPALSSAAAVQSAPPEQPATPQPVAETIPAALPNVAGPEPVQSQAAPLPAGTDGSPQTAIITPAPTERPAGITPPVQAVPAPSIAQTPAPAPTPTPTPTAIPAVSAPEPSFQAPTETTAQPQSALPTEAGRPTQAPAPQNPAPQATLAPVNRTDTGLLSQLASTDQPTQTAPERPASIPTPGSPDTATVSTFDKALQNAATATPQQTATANAASPTAAPPLSAEAPVSGTLGPAPAGGDPLSTTAPVVQNAHNVSIRFGMSPQLGANGQTPVNTLAFNIAKNFDNGVTRFQVRIDPPELGRVDVKLDMTVEGRVRAHLTVERSETLELMMRDARGLEKALADTGLNLTKESLSFSLKDQNAFSPGGDGPGTETDNPSAPETAPADIDEPLPEQMTRGYISDSGVDIKV